MPFRVHLSLLDSHSDSGSHLIDRQAASTLKVMRQFVSAPKRVIMNDAVLVG